MPFHPLLRDLYDRVFLVHCEVTHGQIKAGLLVTDGTVTDFWIPMGERQGLEGTCYMVKLPAEVLNQPERFKGYDVILSAKTS